MNKYRFEQKSFCKRCRKIIHADICQHCGGTFMGREVDPFSTIREQWVKVPIKIWNPLTWLGGKWKPIEAKGNFYLEDIS